MKNRFDILSTASRNMKEHNDCSVKAVAVVCGVRYRVAHAAMLEQGRINRKGAATYQILRAIEALGYGHKRVACRQYMGHSEGFALKGVDAPKWCDQIKTVITLSKALPSRGVFLAFTNSHVLGCRAGQVMDWTQGRRHQVNEIYKITSNNGSK